MVHGRNLSKKITDRLTISISPYLKDWLNRFVKEESKKNPKVEKFSSISRFISHIIELSLEISEENKSLEELKELPGNTILEFYDDITFRAVIDTYEENIEKSKYDMLESDQIITLYLKYKDFLTDDNHVLTDDIMDKKVKEFNKFFAANNVTNKFNLKVKGNKYYIDFSGRYPNIHFVHCKGIIGIFGILGMKLIDIIIGKDYSKMEFEKTYLFNSLELNKKERKRLYRQNIKKLCNYFAIVNDKRHHLWITLSNYENNIISFRNRTEGKVTIDEIVEEIIKYSKYGYKREILKLFEKFNWIKVTETLTKEIPFEFSISEENHQMEIDLTLDTLNRYGNLRKQEKTFYFK